MVTLSDAKSVKNLDDWTDSSDNASCRVKKKT